NRQRWRRHVKRHGVKLRQHQHSHDHGGERRGREPLEHDTVGGHDAGELLAGQPPGHRRGPRETEERIMKTRNPVRDEQGIAFPMALIVMAILGALMAAFAVLATSEPQIASNQMHSVQARALAESGVARALWALTQGEASTPPSGALVNSEPP